MSGLLKRTPRRSGEDSRGSEDAPATVDADAPTSVLPPRAEPPDRAPEPTPEPPPAPSFRERARFRRRARYLRRRREVQLRDLGGLVFELRRRGRENPELVTRKLDDLAACDRELRSLQEALGDPDPTVELREPGLGGACPRCATLHGSADRFCAHCGLELGGA
jgi:hypothetical protein